MIVGQKVRFVGNQEMINFMRDYPDEVTETMIDMHRQDQVRIGKIGEVIYIDPNFLPNNERCIYVFDDPEAGKDKIPRDSRSYLKKPMPDEDCFIAPEGKSLWVSNQKSFDLVTNELGIEHVPGKVVLWHPNCHNPLFNVSFTSMDEGAVQKFKETCRIHFDWRFKHRLKYETNSFIYYEIHLGKEVEIRAECKRLADIASMEFIEV